MSALRQLNNLAQQKQQAAEIQDFLRDKFTNHALYLFLQQETAALHRQMFDIAWCWARQAQRAFQLERELTTQTYLPLNVWDGLHEGLMAGERLSTALRAMEKAYFDQNRREQELVTRLSLRLDFPLAFLQLKATGACEIEIPEWRLDREYPGHYLRRIKIGESDDPVRRRSVHGCSLQAHAVEQRDPRRTRRCSTSKSAARANARAAAAIDSVTRASRTIRAS